MAAGHIFNAPRPGGFRPKSRIYVMSSLEPSPILRTRPEHTEHVAGEGFRVRSVRPLPVWWRRADRIGDRKRE